MRGQAWKVVGPLVLLAVGVVLTRNQLADYQLIPSDDNAAPAIDALLRGDLTGAAQTMPAMGLVSVLLRLPLAALGGSDLMWTHRLGSLACLLVVVALAATVDRRLVVAGRPAGYRAVLAILLVAGPGILFSIDAGHPEEYLCGALCVWAVLAATDGRRTLAAVLLGLAIGTKQWAILAIVPVLLPLGAPSLLDRARLRSGLLAAAVAALFVVPPILAEPHRYAEISGNLTQTARVYAESLWWPVSSGTTQTIDLGGGDRDQITTYALPLGLNRGQVTALALLASIGVAALVLRRRRALRDPLAVLAALLGLRCIVDSMNLDYYLAPGLIAVAVWEATRGPQARLPWLSIGFAVAAVVAWRAPLDSAPAAAWLLWLLTAIPYLAVPRLARVLKTTRAPASAPGPSSPH